MRTPTETGRPGESLGSGYGSPALAVSSVKIVTDGRAGAVVGVYVATVFLSAFLLFQVQLIVGKVVLPAFGGTPAVWNTCMLCFQVLLLLGYGYAHVLSRRVPLKRQAWVHLALLTASAVLLLVLGMRWTSPLTPGMQWKPLPGGNPVLSILRLLGVTVALPFFLLSTTGPLLQNWFHHSQNRANPYRLYALSNAGSLVGLVGYPFFVEWALTLKHQAWLWTAAYVLFVAACGAVAWRQRESSAVDLPADHPSAAFPGAAPRWPRHLLWAALSACSATMLLATTNLLCQNVAVIPLLWVVPLGIYLLSFILTFDSDRWYRRGIYWPLYFLATGGALKALLMTGQISISWQVGLFCLALFAVCMVCHGELARSKPAASHLTGFYLMVALGGALGGVFVVLVAPSVFRGFQEFPLALFACGFLLFLVYAFDNRTAGSEQRVWGFALAVLVMFLLPQLSGIWPQLSSVALLHDEYHTAWLGLAVLGLDSAARIRNQRGHSTSAVVAHPWQPVAALAMFGLLAIVAYSDATLGGWYTLYKERNFFGVNSVEDDLGVIQLRNGNITHGLQLKDPTKRDTPTLYYGRSTGIGLLLSNFPRGSSEAGHMRVGVIGLGVGTLAAYGHAGDTMRFYEIDPAVIELSTGKHPYFYFLHDSPANVETILGDARLSLEREAAQGKLQNFDVFAVDAFASDAIPVHLLTREAMRVYLQHLRGPDSVLAFHISNRYLDLAPVVVALGDAYHLNAVQVETPGCRWILLARNPSMLRLPNLVEKAAPVVMTRPPLLWTDDYSNLFRVFQRSALLH